MSLFSRLFKSKPGASGRVSYQDLVETVGLLLLAAREKRDGSLRHSARLGELLGLLWLEDKPAHQAVYDAFSSVEKLDRDFVELLSRRVYNLQHIVPPTPEGRYAIVVQALQDETQELFALLAEESGLTSVETRLFINVLTLARILLPPELHEPICAFLVANLRSRQDKLLGEITLPSQELVCEYIYRFLASIAPDSIPAFWTLLRDESVTQEFWPVLRRIRDRNAVPYLLELLPAAEDEEGTSAMNLDGQKEVIQVLRDIGDLRAVPVLLAIEKRPLPPPVEKPGIQSAWDRALAKTWRERNELARVAGQAARHILRNSDAPEAQLLRPFDAATSSTETLLRPAPPRLGTTPPGELMRPSDRPERPERPKRTL